MKNVTTILKTLVTFGCGLALLAGCGKPGLVEGAEAFQTFTEKVKKRETPDAELNDLILKMDTKHRVLAIHHVSVNERMKVGEALNKLLTSDLVETSRGVAEAVESNSPDWNGSFETNSAIGMALRIKGLPLNDRLEKALTRAVKAKGNIDIMGYLATERGPKAADLISAVYLQHHLAPFVKAHKEKAKDGRFSYSIQDAMATLSKCRSAAAKSALLKTLAVGDLLKEWNTKDSDDDSLYTVSISAAHRLTAYPDAEVIQALGEKVRLHFNDTFAVGGNKKTIGFTGVNPVSLIAFYTEAIVNMKNRAANDSVLKGLNDLAATAEFKAEHAAMVGNDDIRVPYAYIAIKQLNNARIENAALVDGAKVKAFTKDVLGFDAREEKEDLISRGSYFTHFN